MKKLLTLAAFCAVPLMAPAATKCVLFTNCTFGQSLYNQTDWVSQCNSVQIRGVAACGTSTGQKTENVSISDDTTKNVNCWCRMIIPAVSRWSFANTYSTAGNCARECVDQCAYLGASPHINNIIQ